MIKNLVINTSRIFIIFIFLMLPKNGKSLDPNSILNFFAPFIGAELTSDNRTYTEKYGYYSKYFPGFDWKEVGTCHRYHSTDRNGIACKQPDGSWKIKN